MPCASKQKSTFTDVASGRIDREDNEVPNSNTLFFVPHFVANRLPNHNFRSTGVSYPRCPQHSFHFRNHLCVGGTSLLQTAGKLSSIRDSSPTRRKRASLPTFMLTVADSDSGRDALQPSSQVQDLPKRPIRRPLGRTNGESSARSSTKSPSQTSEAMRLQGSECLATGDFTQAKRLFQRSVDVDPTNGRAWQDLATAVERSSQGSRLDKVKVLEDGLRHNPSNPYLWQSLAVANLRMSKLEEACHHCQQGLRRDPSHASLYVTWATAEEKRFDVATARGIYEKADEFATPGAKLYHSWGRMELGQGNKARARELFEKGLECDSRNHYIWHSLGSMARADHEAGRARDCFAKALQSDMNNVVVLEEWAKLEAYEKNYGLARSLFSRGAAANRRDVRILHSWSLFEYQVSYVHAGCKKTLEKSSLTISSPSISTSHRLSGR